MFCSELMMRDNLFEMVTNSRTFYIQVLLSSLFCLGWMRLCSSFNYSLPDGLKIKINNISDQQIM